MLQKPPVLKESEEVAKTKTREISLPDCPNDCISSLKFSPISQYSLLYNIESNKLKISTYAPVPLLDGCFSDSAYIYAASLDGVLRGYDIPTMTQNVIGSHEKAIRCVEYCPELSLICTGSWDTTVKLWDSKMLESPINLNMGDKVYAMNILDKNLIVATSGRKVLVWDLRYPSNPLEKRDSGQKFQTRSIKFFPNGEGYILSTIEGRVAVEPFGSESTIEKYSFKCHRKVTPEKVEQIYPVNSLSFHNGFCTFATGGSDGTVSVWDPYNKKRVCQFDQFPTSISALCFSNEGSMLAIASSYQFEDKSRREFVPPDSIFVRHMSESEVRLKK